MKLSVVSRAISRLSGSSLRTILPSRNLMSFPGIGSLSTILVSPLRLHRNLDVVRRGEFDGARVAGVRVTKSPHPRVPRKNALETAFGIIGSVGDNNHASVLRETDAYAAAIVNRHPGCARRRIDQRVEQWPICDRITAIEHSFGFAIGRGHGARCAGV